MSKCGQLDDGMGGSPYDIRLQIGKDILIITRLQPKLELHWDYECMRAVQKPKLAVPGSFTTTKTPNARLLLENQKLWEKIYKQLPGYEPPERTLAKRIIKVFMIFLVIALAALALFVVFLTVAYQTNPEQYQPLKDSFDSIVEALKRRFMSR